MGAQLVESSRRSEVAGPPAQEICRRPSLRVVAAAIDRNEGSVAKSSARSPGGAECSHAIVPEVELAEIRVIANDASLNGMSCIAPDVLVKPFVCAAAPPITRRLASASYSACSTTKLAAACGMLVSE